MEEFVKLATEQDTEFEAILIDELPTQYRKDLNLPVRDIILEVKAQYDLFLSLEGKEEPEVQLRISPAQDEGRRSTGDTCHLARARKGTVARHFHARTLRRLKLHGTVRAWFG